jgi:hypothetical protein
MAELFQVTPQNVTLHLKAIYAEGELGLAATGKDYLQVRSEGGRRITRELKHYSLPVILAVGYRVRSRRGTQFRQWATARLTEYLVKGFALDDERLKSPPGPGVPDHFDELLERIRDIRASERRMYLRVREILAMAADGRKRPARCSPASRSTCTSIPPRRDHGDRGCGRDHRHGRRRAGRQAGVREATPATRCPGATSGAAGSVVTALPTQAHGRQKLLVRRGPVRFGRIGIPDRGPGHSPIRPCRMRPAPS